MSTKVGTATITGSPSGRSAKLAESAKPKRRSGTGTLRGMPPAQRAPNSPPKWPNTGELARVIIAESLAPAARPPELTPGQIINGYTILKKVGEGGDGIIYRAKDPQGDEVILKVSRPGRIGRLLAEIVTRRRSGVREFWEDVLGFLSPGVLVLKPINGPTLEEFSLKSPEKITPTFVLNLLSQIAIKLIEHGDTHGDLSFKNIMLEQLDNGGFRVLPIDFGTSMVARAFTTLGMRKAIGTIAFLSPESTRGEKPTPKVDVYALGMMLAMLICKRRPFFIPKGTVIGNPNSFAIAKRARGISFTPPLTQKKFIEAVGDQALGEDLFFFFETMTIKEPEERLSLACVDQTSRNLLKKHQL